MTEEKVDGDCLNQVVIRYDRVTDEYDVNFTC